MKKITKILFTMLLFFSFFIGKNIGKDSTVKSQCAQQPQSCGYYACGKCPAGLGCGFDCKQCCCKEGCESGGSDPDPTDTPDPTPTPTTIPTPTPVPCAPVLFPPGDDYDCNNEGEDDETANLGLVWTLTPVEDPAQEYFFQIAFDRDFSNIDHTTLCFQADQDICELYEGNQGRAIGPTNYFGNTSVESPETARFARVKVKRSFTSCETGGDWVWSNSVVFAENCLIPGSEDDDPPARPLDKFFCNPGGQPTDQANTGEIFSAIGCIPADNVQEFTEFFLTWGISIAGGLSLVLIVYGGFLFMTSQGNPKKVQAGKELITAAVGGLVYLLFAVFMFRLIGLDILKIPGL